MTKQGVVTLDEIIASRRRRLEERRQLVPLDSLQRFLEERPAPRDFKAALNGEGLSIVAELKRASPSRGMLRQIYRREEIAQGYETARAAAVSVLTEEEFFLGSLDDLGTVRNAIKLPVLRKDFILHPYQIYESAAAGADAILLIVAVLRDTELLQLVSLADQLDLTELVEVHTEPELERALDAGARIIGVNNRDLKTMEVRLQTSLDLRDQIPSRCLAVSESGIKTPEDLQRLARAGFNAALIGEHFMSAEDPGKELARMLKEQQSLPEEWKGSYADTD
jgi:indole-3-glycerol phosphate synthase